MYAACTGDGTAIEDECVQRLFSLDGTIEGEYTDITHKSLLDEVTSGKVERLCTGLALRNVHYFETESEKLEGWADDLKSGLEREIKDIDLRRDELIGEMEGKLKMGREPKTLFEIEWRKI